MKKILSVFLVLIMILAAVPNVFADEQVIDDNTQAEEDIKYHINYLSERIYNKREMSCYPLDISSACNRGFADEVAGDGVGGWSDQGPKNDLANFGLRGKQSIYNIPFNFIEPANNDGKSCIMLRGQNDESCPLSAEVPVNDTAEGMFVIHGAAWGNKGKGVGRYGFIYEDGTSASFEIICGSHINDFWGITANDYVRTAWTGSNPSSSVISLNLFPLNNPHPEKKIKSIKFTAYGDYTYMGIVGVTMVRSGFCFPLSTTSSTVSTLKPASDGLWATAKFADENEFKGTIMDSSSYLDAPAGKHGKLSARGEDFYFADGTKAKFWGTNIAGDLCYPDNSVAEELASRIARCGYNLVRFVDMDKSELTNEKLDKLAYFQSLLKEKGIYTYFSLLGSRPGDGEDITDGWKIEGLFKDDLINEQEKFAKQLLTYNNRYTGTSFAEDDSLVMIDLANRNTMFDYRLGDGTFTLMSDESKQLITKKFNEFLKNKYKTTQQLKSNWDVVYDDECIEDGTIAINGNWKYGLYYDDNHRKDVYEFLGQLQKEYYDKLSSAIKSTGYTGLISGVTNTWNNITPYNSYSQSTYTDFLSVNSVGANSYCHNILEDGLWCVDYDSIVTGDNYDGNEFLEFAENRVSGTPYVVSEWGSGVITPTFYETPVVMSVLSAQQNWTPIQYCFAYDELSTDIYKVLYSTYQNPVSLSLAQLSAALFYNTDELNETETVNFNFDYLYKDKNLVNGATPNINKKVLVTPCFPKYYSKKSSVKFSNGKTDEKKAADSEFVTINKNINFDLIKGQLFAKNNKAIAFVGSTLNIEKYGRLKFNSYSNNIFTGLISVDGKNIDKSERMLYMIGARTLNSNMDLKEAKVESVGNAPIIYDAVTADITIDNAAGYNVYPLDATGQRMTQLKATNNADGSLTFGVNYNESAINYEIVKED